MTPQRWSKRWRERVKRLTFLSRPSSSRLMDGRGLEKEESLALRERVGEEEGVRSSLAGGEGTVRRPADSVGGGLSSGAGHTPRSSTNLQTNQLNLQHGCSLPLYYYSQYTYSNKPVFTW